ncbi:MAG TPA: permease [Desulfotomaculum sp.]|nr:permease [Desulfotomaculum sp.]
MFQINSLAAAGKYFVVIAGELLVLFIGISFLIALLQEFVPEETVRRVLTKPGRGWGNVLGAVLGAVTPFCSCSTIPILVGLLNGGAPFGASMSFLLASPLLNPVILGLILTLMGWRVALIYGVFTFLAAVFTGALWERLGLAGEFKRVRVVRQECCCCAETVRASVTNREKVGSAAGKTWDLFRQVVPYLLIGAGIGAFIYGFVPEQFIVRVAGPGNPLAIPVAAIVGVPMYIRVETMLPIAAVLQAKGMSLGAIMALIIGGGGASIPEITLLAAIFKPRLLVAFVLTIFAVAVVAGYMFELIF